MNIISIEALNKYASHGRCWLSTHAVNFEHEGKNHSHFIVVRGDEVVKPELKFPDAVVIGAIYLGTPSMPARLLVTKEFRPACGCEEYGFPAGLIDDSDYPEGKKLEDVAIAACAAAVREVKEETGLRFVVKEFSPNNLYSSAGMTNESIVMVLGYVEGTPSKEHLEGSESIDVELLTQEEVVMLLENRDLPFSKTAWPFMRNFAKCGEL